MENRVACKSWFQFFSLIYRGFPKKGIVVVAGLLPKFCLVVVDLRRTHGIVLSTHRDIS